jgi:nucleotide-binding universal stress UspA family protein
MESGARTTPSCEFPPKHILCPIDGSENANRALKVAISLAKMYLAELLILTVAPRHELTVEIAAGFQGNKSVLSEYFDQMDKRSNRFLEEASSFAKKEGYSNIQTESVPEFESVAKQILEKTVSRKIDLVVMGTRGLGGFRRLLMGSVSSTVVAHAKCNVLVVR